MKMKIIKKYLSHYQGLPIQCWQGITLTLLESFATGICFFLSLYFVNILHISVMKAGVLISCYGMGTIFGGIIGGKLCDIFSAKKIAILSLSMQAIGFIFLANLFSFHILAINLFLLGLCTYGFMTANNVWMIKQCQNQLELRLKAINISRASSNLGLAFSGIVIGILNITGFKTLFYLSSGLLIFSVFYFICFVQDTNSCGDEIATRVSSQPHSTNNHFISVLTLSCLFLVGLVIAQLNITYPIYIQKNFPNMLVNAVSVLFILDTTLIVIFQTPLVNSLKKYNNILLVGVGAFLMGLGMFMLIFSFTFSLAVISCIIWTTGEMIFIAMAQFVCYERGLEKKKGQTMGIFQAVSATSRVLGPSAGGFIYETLGSDALWGISLLIGLFCLSACLHFRKYDFVLGTNTNASPYKRRIASESSF